MAKTTRLFQHLRAVELIMSLPSPSTRKRIGRGVRNFDSGIGDRETKNAVLSDIYPKFTQNPALNNHLLSYDNKILAESSPPDPVWGIGLRAADPRANNPCQGRGQTFSVRHFLPSAKIFATVRPSRPPLVGSAPALRVHERRNLVRAAAGPLRAASARTASPSEFPTYYGRVSQLEAMTVWRQLLASVLGLLCRNMAPVWPEVLLLCTTFRLR